MKINIKKLCGNAVIPARGSDKAAGYDLHACTKHGRGITIAPHKTVKIHTGISMAIPDGYFGAIFARSGLASNNGLRPATCVSVIDSDYRGEIVVPLHNDTHKRQSLGDGARIAQLVILPYLPAEFCEVNELDETARGAGGFGSTGVGAIVAKESVYEQLSLFND